MEAAFLLATLLSLATGAVYGYVGLRLSRRRVSGPSRLASALFSAWWFTLAGMTLGGALVRLGARAGLVDLPMYVTWTYVSLLAICFALWALMYYLVYLLTGSRRLIAPLTALYATAYVACVYVVSAGRPESLVLERWTVKVQYASPPEPLVALVLVLALLGPPTLAAAGYFRLLFRVEGATQRYRVGLVSVTFLTWFLSATLAAASELNRVEWWPIASGLIGLLAALLIYLAYRPPGWVQRRYGVEAVDAAPA